MRIIVAITLVMYGLTSVYVDFAIADWVEEEKPVMEGVDHKNLVSFQGTLILDSTGEKSKKGTYFLDTKSGKPKFLADDIPAVRRDLYGRNMVFKEGDKIVLFNIDKKKKKIIGKGRGAPSVNRDVVAYEDKGHLVLYNIVNEEEKRIKLGGKMVISERVGPSLLGLNEVVWIERDENGDGRLLRYKYKLDVLTELRKLSKEFLSTLDFLAYRSSFALLSNKDGLSVYDVNSGKFKKLSSGRPFLPSISRGIIIWDSNGGETIEVYNDIAEVFEKMVSKGSKLFSPTAVGGEEVYFVDRGKSELRMFRWHRD